jgi:two-component system nitrogen regulation sensor histidine kinase NtrY
MIDFKKIIKSTLFQKQFQRYKLFFVFLLGSLAILSSLYTYFTMSSGFALYDVKPSFPLKLVVFDIFLIVLLLAIIGMHVYTHVKHHRKHFIGGEFQSKIIYSFVTIAILPSIIIMMFSFSFLNSGVQMWFNERIDNALNDSLKISQIYVDEHKDNIADDLHALKRFAAQNTDLLLRDSNEFEKRFAGQAAMLSLTEAVIFFHKDSSASNNVLAKTSFSFFPDVENIHLSDYKDDDRLGVKLIFNKDDNYIRAIEKFDVIPNAYILVGKLVNDHVISYINNAKAASGEYVSLQEEVSKLQRQFIFIFVIIVILILLAVTWFGMFLVGDFISPIIHVVSALKSVRKGDYKVRVNKEKGRKDEVSDLIGAFNNMTEQVEKANSELASENHIVNAQKTFLETVLGAMPAAMLVLDTEKKVKIFNKAARTVFADDDLKGQNAVMVLPEIEEIIKILEKAPDMSVKQVIFTKINNESKKLLVSVSVEQSGGEISGYIVNISDLS